MATFKVLLDTRRQLKNQTYPLILRIYSGRTFKDINLKTYLLKNQFDPIKQRVKKTHPNGKAINALIDQHLISIQEAKLTSEFKDESITAEKLKNIVLRPNRKLNFIEYAIKIIEDLREINRTGNANAYRDAINALLNYSGRKEITFTELDYEFLTALEKKMLMNGLKKNTIACYNRSLRAIYNKAINEALVEMKFYPYRKYKIKGEVTAKRNIKKEDIISMRNLNLEKENPAWDARNFFLLSFYFQGMSFADLTTIKPNDIINGRLVYRRKKTHKIYSIKILEQAQKILDLYYQPNTHYILPILNETITPNSQKERAIIQLATKKTNNYLKKIARQINLQAPLTTYYARHSWATIAKKLGYSKDIIAEALGHEYGNRITGIYLDSFDQDIIDEMNKNICS